MRISVLSAVALASIGLAGCESGGSGGAPQTTAGTPLTPIVTPTPVPSPSPSPSPSPAPSPAPSPTPSPTPSPANSPLDDGKIVLGIEGDSISIDYAGYYAGYFKQQHPAVEVHNQAVGGSTLDTITARRDQLIAFNPDIVTVFVGANDLGKAASAQAWVDRILAYVAPIRARGTKVLVASNLARQVPTSPAFDANHNLLREQVAVLLKAQVGKGIDGVIDFAGHPIVGQISAPLNTQLFSDGLHPTDRNFRNSTGGHDYLYDVYRLAVEPLLTRQ